MSITAHAALIDVTLATRARVAVDAEARSALRRQAEAIRAALQAGASAADVAKAAGGISTARVYQIRDDTR